MIVSQDTAVKIAEHLLQIKAIKLQPHKPFVWASGWKAPIYCDNRRTLSYPKIRNYLREQFIKVINEKCGKPDVICGVATGGIAHGILIADALNLPFCYVRAEAKVHGLTNLIEGVVGAAKLRCYHIIPVYIHFKFSKQVRRVLLVYYHAVNFVVSEQPFNHFCRLLFG